MPAVESPDNAASTAAFQALPSVTICAKFAFTSVWELGSTDGLSTIVSGGGLKHVVGHVP
jgi:hypothetical protein